ncbi:MAG: response regulator transcription factor [Bacteroidetes bacterium]|nr:response regulator transcription factor [Bacteroidota bacterium]MBK8344946.1 response regulator transcription factor [Bacteroidota bacterium]
MKILIVEDEKLLASAIQAYLKSEGYICEIVKELFIARQKVDIYLYDCILIDIGLPDGNGLELIKEIKKIQPTTGIIIISAKNAIDDKVLGLELGADDYLSKPFHLAEMNARIKSLIRRRQFDSLNEIVFNEIKIFPEQYAVKVNNNDLVLTKKEYALLIFFIANKNRVLKKTIIAEHLWGDNIDMADNFDFIYTHLSNLRKKIVDAGGLDYITSVYGVGYKFTDENKPA